MGFFSFLKGEAKKADDILFGTDPSIMTKTLKDPLKEAVASPLSKFLAGETGKGVPRFEGRITGEFPGAGLERAEEFIGLDAPTFFEERIQAPALETFREDILPQVREEFAGALSGSGRFRTEEEAGSRFVRGLAQTRAELELALPQAQFQVARQMREEADKEARAQYGDWLKSLPQYNPVLDKSISFLQKSTGTGTTILSALDPGTQGLAGDLIAMVASVFGGTTPSTEAAKRPTGTVSSTGSTGIGGGTPGGTSFGGAPLDI